jgi:uncharacterized protein YprB with RNaseH-like and TPR domain
MRGGMMEKNGSNVLFLDCETTGLDASSSQLISIGVMNDKNEISIWFVENPENEKEIIEKFFDFLPDTPCLITFYGSYFDIPFIFARALKNKIGMEKYKTKICNILQVDVYDVTKNVMHLSKNSLADVCRFLDIKKNTEFEGRDMSNIYLKFLGGDNQIKQNIEVHLKDDLVTLKSVFDKFVPIINIDRWMKR